MVTTHISGWISPDLAADELDQDPADEAGPDPDRDVVGQRHEDHRQEGREAILDVVDGMSWTSVNIR